MKNSKEFSTNDPTKTNGPFFSGYTVPAAPVPTPQSPTMEKLPSSSESEAERLSRRYGGYSRPCCH